MQRTIRVMVATAVLGLLVGACSPGEELAEQIIESQGDVDVEIDQSGDDVKIEIEDKEGGVSGVIGGGELPADFPVAVPSGGDVQAVFQQGADSTVSIAYDDGFDSIKAFFEDWIESMGFEAVNTFESSSPPGASWTLQDGDAIYAITVGESGPQVQVTIIVSGG